MATLKEFLKADRFATCAGVELLEIKPGYARACMEVTDRHLNGGGVCQGGALSRFSVFALGIMPYISASIIMQMLS